MRKLLLCLSSLFLIVTSVYAACETRIDGVCLDAMELMQYDGIGSDPATSPIGSARQYFDPIEGKLKCSEDGGSYVDCVTTSYTDSQAQAASGWTRSTGKVVLTNIADKVGIGSTATPTNALKVTGNMDVTGNVGIGTSTITDSLTIQTASSGATVNYVPVGQGGNDANTVLLLHLDNNFTDSSTNTKTFSSTGTVVTTTDQSKFGGYSGFWTGATKYLTASADADFAYGTGDFTIDTWVYITGQGNYTFASNTNGYSGMYWQYGSGIWYLSFNGNDYINTVSQTIGINGWHHIALDRTSGVARFYYDGTPLGASGTNYAVNITSNTLYIGIRGDGTSPFSGYMDEYRITKGFARYKGQSFTPPTRAYDALSNVAIPALKLQGNSSQTSKVWTDGNDANKFKIDVPSTTRMTIDVNGNIGVGTTTPVSLLEVNGGATIGQKGIIPPTNGLLVGGNVGIGSVTPSQKLDVTGAIRSTSFITTGAYTQTGTGINSLTGNVGINSTSPTSQLEVKNNGTKPFQITNGVAGDYLNISSAGWVGIGNVTPNAKLDVVSSAFPVGKFDRVTTATGGSYDTLDGIASGFLLKTTTTGNMTDGFGGGFLFSAQDNTAGSDTNYIARMHARRDGSDGAGAFQFWVGEGGATPALTLRGSGLLGLGTTSPVYNLDVFKSGGDTNLRLNGSGSFDEMISFTNSSANNIWTIGRRNTASSLEIGYQAGTQVPSVRSGGIMTVTSAGYVGIGTTIPSTPLEVIGTDLVFNAIQKGGSGNSVFTLSRTNHASQNNVWYQAITNSPGANGSFVLYPATTADVSLSAHTSTRNQLVIKGSSGNVGIGTTAPTAQLNIKNNASVPFQITNATAGDYVTVTSAGCVGIGSTLPAQQLEITQNFRMPSTTNAAKYGIIYKGATPFIHDFNYGNNGTVTTDGYNTFVGINAGNLTMGSTATLTYQSSNNTAVGRNALQANTTGNNNNANGYASLQANTTGTHNTAHGSSSLQFNTTGNNNTASGYASLYANTTGNNNTANGFSSLQFNTTGNNNTASGYASLYANTTGSQNTANGHRSLRYSTTASNNTALGFHAGTGNGDNTNYNSVIDTNMLFLGMYASRDISIGTTTALTNGIAIGYDSKVLASNQAVLGNDSITTTLLKGNVGIGTTSPTKKLSVADACVQLKSPDGSLSNCCVANDDTFTCTGL